MCNSSVFATSNHWFHSSPSVKSENEQAVKTETDSSKEKQVSPKLEKIVNEIASLNLLEVTQLITALKNKLNLPDTALMGSVSIGMSAAGASATGAPGGAATKAPAKEEEKAPEQTIFNVVLKSFDKEKKVSVIKEVRNLLKLGLKEAKEMVEKAPVKLQSDCPKVDAEAIRDKLKEVGGEIVLE